MSLLHSSTRRLHYMFLYFNSRESRSNIFWNHVIICLRITKVILLHSSTRRLHYMFLYFNSIFLPSPTQNLKMYELVFNWKGKDIKMFVNIHFYLDIFQQCFEIFQNVFWLILLYYWKIPSQILGNLWQVCFEDFNQEDSPSKIRQNSTCSMGQYSDENTFSSCWT